ncbi:MAG: DUF4411 family protein [Dehalococcoidia bacterium]
MNRNRSLIFCFDTSAFVDIHRYLVRLIPQLYPELDKLFNSGRLISHKIVFQEITTRSKEPDSLTKWILPKEAFFKDISLQQTLLVSEIIQQFPTLIHYNKEKDDADPWLIAMVIEQRSMPYLFSSLQNFAIVSTESTLIPNRLPAVCEYYSIKHLDLPGFFKANGWSISLQMTNP